MLLGHPSRQRASPCAGQVRRTKQLRPFGIDREDLAVRVEQQRRRREGVEQLEIEPPLDLERRKELRLARLGTELHTHRLEQHHQVIVRPPRDPRFEDQPRDVRRARRQDVGAGPARGEHLTEQALDLRGLREGKGCPERLAQDPVGGQAGHPRGGGRPLHDRPVGTDRRDPSFEIVKQGSGIHRNCLPHTTTPRWPGRGRNGAESLLRNLSQW